MLLFNFAFPCVPCVPCGSFLLLCLALPCFADAPKPEVKKTEPMYALVGKTTRFTIYGENLSPKEVTVKAPLTVKLIEAKDTDKDNKGKGARQVVVEVVVPENAKPQNYELTLTQTDNAKATAQVPVALNAAAEMEVKKPNGTFDKAMVLSGASVAVNGFFDNNDGSLFRFEAKAGETYEIIVMGRRGGSKADPMVKIRDSRKMSRVMSAGNPNKDRRLLYKIPSDGTYYIELMNSSMDTGAEQKYRLLFFNR